MTWLKILIWLIVAIAVLFAGLSFYGARRWSGNTQQLIATLQGAQKPPVPATFSARELEGLPEPVQRFFRTALTEGQPLIAGLRLAHTGSFNMGQTADQWKPFTSTQQVAMQRPGFVWDANVMMMPGVPVRVHDAYVGGEGILHPSILGVFTLVNMRGTGEIAQGEFMRFAAEAPWYPTALLPSQGARWEAIDAQSAKVTLADGAVSTTLTYFFGSDGLVARIRAEARGRTVGDKIVMTPWEGTWTNYEQRDGMRVPTQGEVAWITPEGRKPYWRGTVTQLAYTFAKP
ncbi:MAG: DUF6920 family protein [Burkholderiaceae bacterium]